MMLSLVASALSYQTAMGGGRPAVGSRGLSSAIMMAQRTPLMAGNWKMNTDLPEAVALAKAVAAASAKADDVDVAVCVPFPFIMPVKEAMAGSKVGIGAQDCHWEEAGAYTGVHSAACAAAAPPPPLLSYHSGRRVRTHGSSLPCII
eukprot:scaffold48835_cov33-Tisochrysis_lutea.AAC.1